MHSRWGMGGTLSDLKLNHKWQLQEAPFDVSPIISHSQLDSNPEPIRRAGDSSHIYCSFEVDVKWPLRTDIN